MEIENTAIREQIRDYIQQATFAEKDKIKNDSLIFKEGYFDSMGFVVLISFLEDNFGVKTTDADLVEDNFESINAITDFIVRKKGN